jgi:DNA-binding HxlR family transcriptional regulator
MHKDCTIYRTVGFISKRWSLLILLALHRNKKRYTEIKKELRTITPKMLSQRLKELEAENLISKKIDTNKFPVKCEYALTESGEDFINIIMDIKQWALKWKLKNKVCENFDCKQCRVWLENA